MSKPIYDELEETGKELLNVLSSFNEKEINQVPFTGSWTAGQVAEHVLKSVSGTLQNVHSDVRPTERNPVEYAGQLKEIFLNFDIKFSSPDFILPSDEPKDKEFLLTALEDAMIRLEKAAKTEDLSATCTAFEMPNMGALTRIEWLSFADAHTRRHIHQLKNIRKTLDSRSWQN